MVNKEQVIHLLIQLIYSSISGEKVDKTLINKYNEQNLPRLFDIAKKHDLAHLLAYGLKNNGFSNDNLDKAYLTAVCRYEKLNYDFENLCLALEKINTPFIPLKGAVIRKYYPEPWMRTSCDIDILIHKDDLLRTKNLLIENLGYLEKGSTPHDISLYSESGTHIELHFDLVEDFRANSCNDVLKNVWDNVSLKDGKAFWYEMNDEFFYLYHIAHMAKHFEEGGCGIRPFIDLWLLNKTNDFYIEKKNALLEKADLLIFEKAVKKLVNIWFNNEEMDSFSLELQSFIVSGGVYGTSQNRVALQQSNKGGKLGYIFSRIFVPFDKLKQYYPILKKHPYLMPFIQVRRWFMLLNPKVAKRAKKEVVANHNLNKAEAKKMKSLLDNLGL